MVSALDSGLSGAGLSPELGHGVVFLGTHIPHHLWIYYKLTM